MQNYSFWFITYLNKIKFSKYIPFDLGNCVEEDTFLLTTFLFLVCKFSVEMKAGHSSTLQRLKST